ncbi:hypothetical protein RF11_05716 [Thelohanellus kitauei]|uniref:Uncharacterized protein n=1 Tax=Thelohanellus kitauei TaxID=669202 RepID=A0A0C2JZI7_THEKT|nr:hypothetical protein RF11_05716 [Thelohanellus kitauei]
MKKIGKFLISFLYNYSDGSSETGPPQTESEYGDITLIDSSLYSSGNQDSSETVPPQSGMGFGDITLIDNSLYSSGNKKPVESEADQENPYEEISILPVILNAFYTDTL